MSYGIMAYSVVDGLDPFYTPGELQTGYFRSERRCPECGRCLNTNGTGRFQCPECNYTDRQDVQTLKVKGLDYNFHTPKRFIFGGQT